MNILKEGVRSALVRLVRYIVYAIIAFAIFWLIGLFTSNKVSALAKKNDYVWDPDFTPHDAQHWFRHGDSADWWSDHNFDNNWTNTTDFDLVGFHFNSYILNRYNNQTIAHDFTENLTKPVISTGILWETDGTGIICYSSSEAEDFILCPIRKNITYTHFTIVSIAVNTPSTDVEYQLFYELERSRSYFNYDSTDVIDYFNENGGIGQIVNQQTITNTTLTQQFQFIQQNDQESVNTTTGGSLDTLSGKFNDMLNGWGGQWSTLTRVVFKPIQLLVNIGDTQNTCQPLRLRIPYVSNSTWGDYNIELPCMGNIYNGFFSNFMSVFSTIIVGLYCYRAIIYFISTIKGVLDAEDDKLEVISL